MKNDDKLRVIYVLLIILFSKISYEIGYIPYHDIPTFGEFLCTFINMGFIYLVTKYIFERSELNYSEKYNYYLLAFLSSSIVVLYEGFFLSSILFLIFGFISIVFWIPFLLIKKQSLKKLLRGMKKEELFE